MPIETTLNVHKNILDMLDKATLISGKQRTSIIKLMIKRSMKDNNKLIKMNSRVKYQERDIKVNWYRIHIVLNEYEYEYCLDFRKFFKMSVSLILAYSVLRYLDEILKENKNTDNYFYPSYILIKNIFEETIYWQIYWGIPPNLHLL